MQIFKSTDENKYSWVEQRRLLLGNSDKKLFAEITHQGAGSKLAIIEVAVLRRKKFRSLTMEDVLSKNCSLVILCMFAFRALDKVLNKTNVHG